MKVIQSVLKLISQNVLMMIELILHINIIRVMITKDLKRYIVEMITGS